MLTVKKYKFLKTLNYCINNIFFKLSLSDSKIFCQTKNYTTSNKKDLTADDICENKVSTKLNEIKLQLNINKVKTNNKP
jgi:hypothetical protein